MTEQELRQLVRAAIARTTAAGGQPSTAAREASERPAPIGFMQFPVPSGPEGTCVIEPSVMCNHCGYCKSYGH